MKLIKKISTDMWGEMLIILSDAILICVNIKVGVPVGFTVALAVVSGMNLNLLITQVIDLFMNNEEVCE